MSKIVKGAGGGGGGKGGGGGSSGRVAQESPDSLRSISYAQVLDLVSEGEIEGFANGLRSVFFNNTPLQNDNGTFNFTDTVVQLVTGTQSQSHIAGFPAVENENIVAVQVEKSGTGVVRQITNADVDAVRVRISIPQLTSQNTTNGDINGTTVQYAIDIQSNGGGYIPQVLGSAWNTDKVTIVNSTLAQSVSPIYQMQIQVNTTSPLTTYTVEYKLESSGTWLTAGLSVSSSQTSESVVTGYDSEYGWVYSDLQTYSKTFTMPTQAAGEWEMRVTNIVAPDGIQPVIVSANGNYGTPFATISGKTTSKYERSHRIQLTGSAPWDIRVRRLTDDSTSTALQNKTFFEAYTEIIDGKFRYPNSAIVGVKIDSSQFNSIPTRAYDLKLLKVKIPSNYNPVTRFYTGIWDGTFKVAWTDNPAWCFYDLVTNTRYGLGDFVDESQVDKWILYSIGQYCDQLVDDGQGGTEPRYTCNIYLQNREEAYTVINSMASIFRGMPYWASGALTLGYDYPADPEYQFTNSNVIDGSFNYSGSSLKARHTVALVTWNDPEDNYRQKVEYVEDSQGIARFGIVQTEVVAVGCTSRGQANRVGRWLLFTERSETELVTFKTGLEGNPIRPSQIIQVLDELRAGFRRGGRIVSATANLITIDDNDIQNQSGVIGGTLSVILPDGSLETRNISNLVGTTITCSTGFSDAPQPNAIWSIQTSTIQAQLFKVISVTEEEDGFSVSALEHNPNKYAEIENGLILSPRDISDLSIVPPSVANLTAVETLVETGSDVNVKVIISWQASVGATGYEVSYKISDNNYVVLPITKGTSVDLPNAVAGAYIFKVVAVNGIGKRSVPTEISQNILGKTGLSFIDPPTNIQAASESSIAGDGSVQTAILVTWDAPASLFVNQYEVQYIRGSGNFDWGFVSENAVTNTDYGTITTVETFSIDYGSITDPVPSAETDYNSRFTGERSFAIVPSLEGVTYTIRVRAINKIGVKSDFATIDYIAFGDIDPPADPEFYSVKTGFKQLIVEWDLPPDADYDSTEIFRNIVNNRFSSTKIGAVRGTSFVDANLGINETYYYWIRFVDRSGNRSDFSEVITGTTSFIDADQFSEEVMNLFSEAGAYGIEPVATLPLTGDFDGQIKYDTTANKLYRWDATGGVWTDDIFSITSGSVDLASFAAGIEPVSIVSVLPNPTGYTGAKIVFLTTDNKLYRYTGTAWTSTISATDINGTLASDNFSADLRPVEVVATLPATGNFVGRTAVLTTDGKLYRFTATGWSAAVPTTDLSGTISAGQISSNAITTDKLDANSVTTGKIAAGAVTADRISANAITSEKLVSGSVIAGKIAAAAVSTTELAANAITSDKIQAGAIIAEKIAAGSIQTDKIAANAITGGLIAASGVITQVAQINDALITNAKIQNLAVDEAKLANLSVSNAKIQDLSVSTLKIGDNAVTIPVAVSTFVRVYFNNTSPTITNMLSLSINSSGAPKLIQYVGTFAYESTAVPPDLFIGCEIRRVSPSGSVEYLPFFATSLIKGIVVLLYLDFFTEVGTYTYTVQGTPSSTSPLRAYTKYQTISILETKK